MKVSCLGTANDGAETAPQGVWHRPGCEGNSQEGSQQSLQAEAPPSPWSPNAYPEEMLSECMDLDCSELTSTYDHSREPSLSFGNKYSADLSEFWSWNDSHREEEERSHSVSALETGRMSTGSVESQRYRGGAYSEPPHGAPESQIPCVGSDQAVENPVTSFEQATRPLRPEMPFRLTSCTERSTPRPPSIIVSNSTTHELADGNMPKMVKSNSETHFPQSQTSINRAACHHLEKPVASSQQRNHPGLYSPNNYEIATQDRQRPDVGEIEPQSREIAAASIHEFFLDADLTASAVAAATAHRTDKGTPSVKRRRLSRNQPAFQTPADTSASLQYLRIPSRDPPTSSTIQNSLQIPTYPTPPSSFLDSPTQQYLDHAYTRNGVPPTQATSLHNSSTEPRSPVSPSPSILTEADDRVTCPKCPEKVFVGPNKKNSLQRHIRDNHSGKARLKCPVQSCDVTFKPGRTDNVAKHVRATHPDHPSAAPPTKRKRKSDSQ